jgi:hypothetical protein
MVVSADGDLAFLHGLKHGGLRLGRGAVDFVRQDDVGEDGPLRNRNSRVPWRDPGK